MGSHIMILAWTFRKVLTRSVTKDIAGGLKKAPTEKLLPNLRGAWVTFGATKGPAGSY